MEKPPPVLVDAVAAHGCVVSGYVGRIIVNPGDNSGPLEVHMFYVEHRVARLAYAWRAVHPKTGWHSYHGVLGIPPVDGPAAAVRQERSRDIDRRDRKASLP